MFKFKLNFLKKMDKNTILIAIAIIAILITGVLIYANSNNGFSLSGLIGKSPKQVAEAAIKYINDNKMAETEATLVNYSEESGVVKITIKIGENEFPSYVSKDGRFLFAYEPIDMKPEEKKADDGKKAGSENKTLEKADNAKLEAFVVSDCPYGLQMQRAMADAVKNAPELASNVIVRYIGSVSDGKIFSMHDPEANGIEGKENLRQICLREEQPAKYWDYVSCYMKKATGKLENGMPIGDTTGCLVSTGVDTSKLNSCMSDSSKGLAYAKVDFDISDSYGVSGSPTLFLNGTKISESNYGGRSSDGVKSMVCAGSNKEGGYCANKLNTTAAAASFSETYSSSSGSANAVTCN